MGENIYRIFDGVWNLSLVGGYCVLLVLLARLLLQKHQMVLLSVMGNRVCAVVLSDTTGDRNQSDSGQIAVCGDRDDVRAADSRSGQSWLCRGQRYEGYRRCPAAGV